MAQDNNVPVDLPENLYAWLIVQAEKKKVTVEDLTANALNHYRAAVSRGEAVRLVA